MNLVKSSLVTVFLMISPVSRNIFWVCLKKNTFRLLEKYGEVEIRNLAFFPRRRKTLRAHRPSAQNLCGTVRSRVYSDALSAFEIVTIPLPGAGRTQYSRERKLWPYSEIAAKLLMRTMSILIAFSECARIHKGKSLDFDSAIPWFESRRPSQL